ncbi:hypothetical protein ACFORJ_07950 [Corynebacterium hansenii]|uniref:Uncharacterized protein n=1 Tax=Corynebacterium hansenii TaxID=394964 RepID=A0ABV7ZRN3_9CORY|nr:hypothetical protein [Corynebacterium hansenii]WJZ00684.1 hypothetical protein CHAN_10415 [Corynebacterium hansenii]
MTAEDDDREAWRWWESLPPGRRAGIHRWIESKKHEPDEIPGQLAIEMKEAQQ